MSRTSKHLSQIERIRDEAAREIDFWEAMALAEPSAFDISKSARIRDLYRQLQKAERILSR